jgi:sugar phosphate isomerase/epimerase
MKVDYVQIDPSHIPSLKGSGLQKLKELLQSYPLKPILGSVIDLSKNPSESTKNIAKYQEYLDASRNIDAKMLRGVCGADRFQSLDIQSKNVIANSKALVKPAEDAGVVIAFENHGTLLSSELISIIQAVNSSQVRINLDNGNSLLTFEDPLVAFENMAPYTSVLHFKDFKRRQTTFGMVIEGCGLGEGIIDLKKQLMIYKKVCPRSPLCLELSLKQGNERNLVKKSLNYLRKMLQE